VARQLPTLVTAGDKCKTTVSRSRRWDLGYYGWILGIQTWPSGAPGTESPFATVCLCVYGSCRLILIQVPPNMISVSSAFQL